MYPWVAETFLPTFCFGDSSVSSDLSDSSSFCNGSYSSVTKMTLIVKRKIKPSLFFFTRTDRLWMQNQRVVKYSKVALNRIICP